MTWYAVDAIDEAFETARSFLFPFDRGRWIRLAVIVFFLGSTPSGSFQFPQTGVENNYPSGMDDILLLIVGVVFVLAVVFGLIGSVMQFVLLDSIRADSIHIRRYFRNQFWKGVRLFLFHIGVFLLIFLLVLFGVVAVLAVSGLETSLSILLAVVLVPVGVAVVFAVGLVLGFTNSFVAPVMLLEDRGVISGWQRFWPTLKADWKQYALYVVVNFFLNLAAGIGVFLLTVLVGLVIVLAVAIPTVIAYLVAEIVGVVVGIVLGLIGVAALLIAMFLIQITVTVYFRYYSLLVLEKTNDAFELIPDPDADTPADSDAAHG